MPTAMNAAFSPTTPPPMITTVAAVTPGTPPSRMPRPPRGRSSMNAPACVAILPATSLIGASSGSRPRSSYQPPPPQAQPELDAVACPAEIAAGQLLDSADPVAQRVAVAVQLASGALPLPVRLDEGLERAEQLVPVLAAAVGQGAEHA